MATIDCITAILAIPTVEEDGELRDALPGDAVLDQHFARLERDFAELSAGGAAGSRLESLLAGFVGQPLRVQDATLSWYEKKGKVYPAVVLPVSGLRGPDGESLAQPLTRRFREADARSRLAELLGKALAVDWASVFVTYGPEG